MIILKRFSQNPIFVPNKKNQWEAEAVFNGCPVKNKDKIHFVYRAQSSRQVYFGEEMEISSIGYAQSKDGINFSERKIFITPEYSWEQFGCEDPRVTKLEDKYFIFYTALADWPPTAEGIKIGMVITKDFENIDQKHQITHFNSKAMALFPEKINGKMGLVFTLDTDKPPSKICLAFLDREEDLWSQNFWQGWLERKEENILPLQRSFYDQVEVGAPPLKTSEGWLLVYSYIKDYLKPPAIFGIEAVLLDLKNPLKILGRTSQPLLIPEAEYEVYGRVPKVVFPSGALLLGEDLFVYYGAADTTCCVATLKIKELLDEMKDSNERKNFFLQKNDQKLKLERYEKNPIITPIKEHSWEEKCTFNAAAVLENNKIHIVYRASDNWDTSVLGYASSDDGFNIKERLENPIYVPREDYEKKLAAGPSGCEDPRITKIKDRFYMCYTAFTGIKITRIAFTSIKVDDFLNKNWNWSWPIIISDPTRSDKNACVFPEKIKGKYVFFHRIGGCIWIDYISDLDFFEKRWLGGRILICASPNTWTSAKVGIGPPPIKTEDGWLLIYHGLCKEDNKYRLGAMLLDLKNPGKILANLPYPILEPETSYEKNGIRPETVFSCGAVIKKEKLFVYYGAADETTAVAYTELKKLLKEIKKHWVG